MNAYPCLRITSQGQNSHSCKGTMEEADSGDPRKAKFVCDKCGREGWWWEIKSVPRRRK